MPTASPELRAEWRDPKTGDLDPSYALSYLRERKIIPDADGYFHIVAGQYLSKKSWRALDFLVQEWDYAWTWK